MKRLAICATAYRVHPALRPHVSLDRSTGKAHLFVASFALTIRPRLTTSHYLYRSGYRHFGPLSIRLLNSLFYTARKELPMKPRPILAILYDAAGYGKVRIDRRNRGIRTYQPTPTSAARLTRLALTLSLSGAMKLVPTTYGWYLAS